MGAPRQIASHTGLRGIAALLVMAYHSRFGAPYLLPFERATALFARGYLMVDLFFILSGFIIAYANFGDRRSSFDGAEARAFLIRRFIRIYPLLFAGLNALLLFRLAAEALHFRSMTVAWDAESLVTLASQYLMINAWMDHGSGWNVATWSISAEVIAYLIFPVLVTFQARSPRLALGLLIGWPLAYYGWIAGNGGSLDITGGTAPLRCLAGFALGMAIYRLRDGFAAASAGLLATVQLCAAVAIILLLAVSVNDVLLVPPFILLVGACWADRGPVARWLGSTPMRWLGERSYSIYLNHIVVIAVLASPFHYAVHRFSLDPAIGRALYLAVFVPAVLIVSHISYRLIEDRSRRYLTRAWLHRPATPIVEALPAP